MLKLAWLILRLIFLLLHCGTNDLKKDITPQKIAQNILKLTEKASGRKGIWQR